MQSFKDLLESRLFDNDEKSTISVQLAAAILMYKVGRSDGQLVALEVAEIVDILRAQFGLKSDEIRKVMQSVNQHESSDVELEWFTKKLRDQWGERERVRLLKDFWVIALADEEIDTNERELIDQLAGLLAIDEEEITRARFHAEQKLELKAC